MRRFVARPVLSALVAMAAAAIAPAAAAADSLVFGFQGLDVEFDALSDGRAPGVLARNLTTAALTSADETSGGAGFVLNLAGALEVSPDLLSWSFAIKPEAEFSNGNQVTPADAAFSINRCARRGGLEGLQGAEASPDRVVVTLGAAAASDPAKLKDFPRRLAECPIIEERSSRMFGARLGRGTNFVASGPYLVTETAPGKRLVLERRRRKDPVPEKIEFRSFANAAEALQQLRSGSFDLVATEDPGVIEKVKKDETLLLAKCSIYTVLFRRGLRFSCDPNWRPSLQALSYEK